MILDRTLLILPSLSCFLIIKIIENKILTIHGQYEDICRSILKWMAMLIKPGILRSNKIFMAAAICKYYNDLIVTVKENLILIKKAINFVSDHKMSILLFVTLSLTEIPQSLKAAQKILVGHI